MLFLQFEERISKLIRQFFFFTKIFSWLKVYR